MPLNTTFSAPETEDGWPDFVQSFRAPSSPLPEPWNVMFAPLRNGAVDNLMVLAQIGQSLDGRVATESGHSRYINGPAGLAHLHRLRALVDAVVIGIGTALADDPQLTVRHVTGPSPVRVILDPKGRLPRQARVLADDGVRRIVITAQGNCGPWPADVEIVALPAENGHIAPRAILVALAQRALRRLLIEGGADTISRFLAAGCLDRLHVTVAPIILGSGRPGVRLPPVARADEAVRVSMRTFQLGDELLFDCDLSALRSRIG
jgi:riboflavin-specific deaminase-like protein